MPCSALQPTSKPGRPHRHHHSTPFSSRLHPRQTPVIFDHYHGHSSHIEPPISTVPWSLLPAPAVGKYTGTNTLPVHVCAVRAAELPVPPRLRHNSGIP